MFVSFFRIQSPNIVRKPKFNMFCSVASRLQELDPLQKAALEEQCILVNEKDQVVGKASKRACHELRGNGNLMLHRAFSVFVFNSKNELLLQRRSQHKITFPNYFTNACCSHPLYDVPGELEEMSALGVRRAAQRRLQHELGIPPEEATLDDLKFLTRIHYKANSDGDIWGEHEIDYILVLHKDVTLNPNTEEVSEVCYVAKSQLDDFLNSGVPLTPWFKLIVGHNLRLWWDNLHNIKSFVDRGTIHKLG